MSGNNNSNININNSINRNLYDNLERSQHQQHQQPLLAIAWDAKNIRGVPTVSSPLQSSRETFLSSSTVLGSRNPIPNRVFLRKAIESKLDYLRRNESVRKN